MVRAISSQPHASVDQKRVVSRAYDLIGERYSSWAIDSKDAARARYEQVLIEGLPKGADLLDLGCGNGVPTTRRLAKHFRTTAVDFSLRQAARAREQLPEARVVCADMTHLQFAPGSFDAVSAFFSIVHVPRDEHGALLESIAWWLRTGGLFVASMTARSLDAGYEEDWLGTPMCWSGYDADTNQQLVEAAGLNPESSEVEGPDSERFQWLVARKPRPA